MIQIVFGQLYKETDINMKIWGFGMSEELTQKGLENHGLKIGNYEYYNIGSTTLLTLKNHKIIQNKTYDKYNSVKPDMLLVDRRNSTRPKVIAVIEYKSSSEFRTKSQKKEAIEQCNMYAQVLNADVGIATDKSTFVWFNPQHSDSNNEYQDEITNTKRSYSIIHDEDNKKYIESFYIDQNIDESVIAKLCEKTKKSIFNVEKIRSGISDNNSKLEKPTIQDPTTLAKQIWQDVWSATGNDPEKCLYTFVELFIFKYLSDLKILTEDENGNKIDFEYIYSLGPTTSFKNYFKNVRTHLKQMFKESIKDNTTIINGTVLNPKVNEHNKVFYDILTRFDKFGKIKNIDPSFKSKIFEDFMKESISTKNWGRYFTPRNVVDAIINMSNIDDLENGSKICDPACGVGGFILEPLKIKNIDHYYKINSNKITAKYNFYGFDKGFEKEHKLTIILAKANMLIFLSEILKKNDLIIDEFSKLLNKTFTLMTDDMMGTLSRLEPDTYDLILTNPPYVINGSSIIKKRIKEDSELKNFYKINGLGLESLFLEWIIRCIKPSKKAFVIIPDGILSRMTQSAIRLREFIKQQCYIDGIVSLPINTFYTTPEKTYILALTKKEDDDDIGREKNKQTEPIFTYLIKDIGEQLNNDRFVIEENDLIKMVISFKQFIASKNNFKSKIDKCKIIPIKQFDSKSSWIIDRINKFWSEDELIKLGLVNEIPVFTLSEFMIKIKDLEIMMKEYHDTLSEL